MDVLFISCLAAGRVFWLQFGENCYIIVVIGIINE